MLDFPEQPATDSTVADATSAANAAPATSAEDQTTEQLADGLQQETPDPDDAEDEIDGVKLRGNKETLARIKAERLMHADYTRKTQEVAETRKAVDAEREQHQQQVKLGQQLEQDKFQLYAVDSRLRQLSQLNMPAIRQQNPELAEQLRDELMRLQAGRPALLDSLRQKEGQLTHAEQRDRATLAQKALDYLQREFKDWSQDKDRELEQFAKGEGLDTQQLSMFMLKNPAIMRVLNKAAQYDKLVAQRASKPPPAPPKPAQRVGGNAAANTKPISELSTADYIARRQKQKYG